MNPRYAIHEEIDRYLKGQMGAAERRAFEEQLASSASVRAEFEAQKIAHELIFEDALIDLKKQMQLDMNGGGATPPAGGSGRNYRHWLIGLGGGILCLSALYYFFSSGEKPNKNLLAEQNTTPSTQQAPAKKEIIASGSTSAPAVSSGAGTTPAAPFKVAPVAPAVQDSTPVVTAPAPVAPAVTVTDPPAPEPPVTTPTPTTPKPADPAPKDPDPKNSPETNINTGVAGGAYTFQPEQEGNWTLPYQDGKQGTFRLVSRTGSTVYQTHFSSGTSQQWNGNDAAGVALPAGYYIYLIEYDQGGVEKGSLTIIR